MFDSVGLLGKEGSELFVEMSGSTQQEIGRLLFRKYVNISDPGVFAPSNGKRRFIQRGMSDWRRTLNVACDAVDSRRMNSKMIAIVEGEGMFLVLGKCRIVSILALLSDSNGVARLVPGDRIWVSPKGAKAISVHGIGGVLHDMLESAARLKASLDHVRTCDDATHRMGRCSSAVAS